MKKRVLSIALTVALLITLIPMAAIPVKAASEFVVTQECVDLIKKWEGFSAKPYWDYRQWTIGYGTSVPADKLEEYKANGISKEEAEQHLIEHLAKDGEAVNAFIDKHGLTFTQGMFDAIVSLCYNCGKSWLNESSTLITAIIEGWTGDDMLFALGQWSTAGGVTQPALIRRRLAEANMYLNGIYDFNLPENYSYVRFDPNGGECEIKTQGYDTNVAPAIRAVPTYKGYKFEGWFTDATGGEQVTKLDEGVMKYTLYAHWSAEEGEGLPEDTTQETISGTAVNYQRQVATSVLNAFDNPVKGALVVKAYKQGDVVDIVEEYTDTAGTKWGKVKDSGWINLTYTSEIKTDSEPVEGVTVTVTATDVNIRKGPGTGYACAGKANKGDTLVITETATGSGYTWGKFEKGWIALKYTTYNATSNDNNTNNETGKPGNTENNSGNNAGNTDNNTGNSNSGTTTTKVTGKVTLSSGSLNIRSGAGTGYKVVGSYPNGAKVEILEQKTVGSTIWGRTDKGWISLDYVKLDAPADNSGGEADTNKPTDDTNTEKPDTDNSTDEKPGTEDTNKPNGDAGTEKPDTDNSTDEKPDDTNEPSNEGNTEKPDTENGNTGKPDTDDSDADDSEEDIGVETETVITGVINVTSGYLNVRKEASTSSAVVGRLYPGSPVVIYEKKTVGSLTWGRISNGWICMDYVTVTSETTTTKPLTGTVVTGGTTLRVRSGPGSSYSITDYLQDGTRVEILERKKVNGVVWGRISKGWIMMDFVKLDSDDNADSNTGNSGTTDSNTGNADSNTGNTDNSNNTTEKKVGTVTLKSGTLNVRAGAGTSYKVVGYLVNGAKVEILETKEVDGMTWGRVVNGWVSMNYIKF